MNTPLQRLQVNLPDNSIFELVDAAGLDVECRSGSVWVTQDGELRDLVLAPGEHFHGDSRRRALVSALEASCIAVSAPRLSVATTPVHRSPWRLALPELSPA